MELKVYLKVLLKKWWILIPTFLITFVSGVVFTYTQTPIYQATATYVVVPGASFDDQRSFANGLDMLGRREEIATTFTEIASSRSIKELALQSINLKSSSGYSIGSDLRRSTNIIEITTTGPDPLITQKLANAIGTAVEGYVEGLYEVFVLIPLDEASTPTQPISPKTSNNLILAAIFGLALGGGLAFLANYLEAPLSSDLSLINIIDSETGTYNREYFLQRLSKEMIRAKRNRYPLSLALLRVDNLSLLKGERSVKLRTELLQKIAVLLNQHLREEDVVAYFGDGVFALLLPDMTGKNAEAIMEYLQARVAWTPFESSTGAKFNLKGIVGVAAYSHNSASRDELVAQANRALELAEVADNSNAYFIPNSPSVGETHA